MVILDVSDDGPGLPENELENIFRPFYRVDDARERDTGGFGVGLAIAERAVRLHQGEVRARTALMAAWSSASAYPAKRRHPPGLCWAKVDEMECVEAREFGKAREYQGSTAAIL